MLLAEAIKERQLCYNKMQFTSRLIKCMSTVRVVGNEERNHKVVKNAMSEYNALHDKHQRFELLISRSESTTVINLSESVNITMVDAKNLIESYNSKLMFFQSLLANIGSNGDGAEYLDAEELKDAIFDLLEDITNLNSKIEYLMWSTEV
jgi:hypothetical protein